MKSYAPVLTLVVVAALAAVLFVANSLSAPAAQTVAAPAPAASSAPAEPAVPPPPPPPPPPPTPPPAVVVEKVFAGRSSGNEVTVAVAVKDGRAVAYVCDGKKIEAWLQGTAENGVVELTGRKGARLSGTLTGDAVEGTVVLAGHPEWTFSAGPTTSTRAELDRANPGLSAAVDGDTDVAPAGS
jgi:hypothetical protein